MSQYVNEVLEGLKKKAPWESLFIQAATEIQRVFDQPRLVQVRRQRVFIPQDVLEHQTRIGAQLRTGQLADIFAPSRWKWTAG